MALVPYCEGSKKPSELFSRQSASLMHARIIARIHLISPEVVGWSNAWKSAELRLEFTGTSLESTERVGMPESDRGGVGTVH